MKRLTERDEFGNADIIGVDSMDLQCNLAFDELTKLQMLFDNPELINGGGNDD